MCISAYSLIPQLPCYYPLHIIYFLHLLSTNHKCTQPCYFPLAVQTCCSEAEIDFGVLQYGVLGERLPRSIVCGVMVSFCCNAFESV
jgi:hypothetical protein